MKKAIFVILIIAAFFLGSMSRVMLVGSSYEPLRISQSFVCPDGGRYRFTTHSFFTYDIEVGDDVEVIQLTVDCVQGEVVTRANVTTQAEALFTLIATGGWFVTFLTLWLLIAVWEWLRPRPLTSPSTPITLAAADQEHLLTLLRAGRKIEAVKHVHTVSGRSLADAKAYVDQVESTIRQ